MEQSKPRVTITGISGYIGAQVCLHFLRHGGFIVRGTVRSKTNEKKIEPLRKAFGDLFEQLELVEADLLNEQSIIDGCEGTDYIVHTASPLVVQNQPKDENVIIKPAVEGTLAVMRAAHKHKAKKVVITSSIAAIAHGHDSDKKNFTEDDWTNVAGHSKLPPYPKSKMLAEKAAWDFLEALPAEERFELVTILPAIVFGPNLNSANFAVGDMVKSMLLNQMPAYPDLAFPCVDVRDVAQAHLEAVLRDEANGQRFILNCEEVTYVGLGNILKEKYGDQGYPMKVSQLNGTIAWMLSFFNNELNELIRTWRKDCTYDGGKAARVLGIDYVKTDASLREMGDTLIDTGYIEDKRSKM